MLFYYETKDINIIKSKFDNIKEYVTGLYVLVNKENENKKMLAKKDDYYLSIDNDYKTKYNINIEDEKEIVDLKPYL